MSTAILYTGGTIGCVGSPLTPLEGNRFYLYSQSALSNLGIESKHCYSLPVKDSSLHALADWLAIAKAITDLEQKYTTVMVLHGTDTLSYTAAFLTLAFYTSSIRIVLLGGLQPLMQNTEVDTTSDAYAAIEFALSTASPPGVWVVNGSSFIEGHCITKLQTNNWPVFAPLGATDGYVECMAEYDGQPLMQRLAEQAPLQVLAIRWLPDMAANHQALKHSLAYADVVIIESFGNGNGLVSDAMVQLIAEAHQAGKMIILSSQVPLHSIDMRYGASFMSEKIQKYILPSYDWPFSALYVRALIIASLYPPQQRALRWRRGVTNY